MSQKSIVGIVVGLLVLGGIWFVLSKPFQTQVKESFRQGTEWTPENIQADPVGYLTWAMDETGKTEQKLEASVLSLRTKKNAATRSLEKNKADQAEYEKLLAEFKEAYLNASGTFPVKVRSVDFEESGLKRKIVECSDKLKNVTSLVETYDRNKTTIDRKLGEIEQKMSEVTKLKNKLGTDLEIAKVNKSVEGIEGIGDTLNSIVDTTDALVDAANEGVSIDELIQPTGEARVDDEFAKIMGDK